jgi:hypothetical protein
MRTRKDMASFPNVRPYTEPSVSTEGVRTDRRRFAISASRIASALFELATLQGRSAMRSTHELLTGTLFAPQPAVVPVRARATHDTHGRRVA